jgi:DNA-binding transcriptional LysR family regulator
MPSELSMVQVRHCVLVADLGSYHLAAAKAARSQPAITKSIQAIENRLGAALFEEGRRTELTPFGAACMPRFRELLAHHDRTATTLADLVRKDQGSLAIAAIVAVAGHWLPSIIRVYAADFPGVQLRLLDDNSQNVERMVLNHEVDFGIASQISADDGLLFEPLWEDSFGVVCSRDHPLAARRSIGWAELADLPLIGTVAHRQLDGYPESSYLAHPSMHVSTMLSLLSLLQENVGVTVLARWAIPRLAEPTLSYVPLVRPTRTRTIGIVRLAHQTPSPAAAEMLERLRVAAAAGTLRSRAIPG